jgi:hypothetical protein
MVTNAFAEKEVSTVSLRTTKQSNADYANDSFTEFGVLFHRAMVNVWRQPELFLFRIVFFIIFGILLSTLFLDTKPDAQGISNRVSYLVFPIAGIFYTSLEALPIFLTEREVFKREFSGGAYRASSYTVRLCVTYTSFLFYVCHFLLLLLLLLFLQLASQLVHWPFQFIIAVLIVVITWWTINMPDYASLYVFAVLINFTVLVAGHAFTTMVSTMVPSAMAGASHV